MNMSCGVIVGDVTGQLLEWNEAALQLHGIRDGRGRLQELTASFEVSRPDGTRLTYEDWPMVRVIRGESVRNLELNVRRIDTGDSWVIVYDASVVPAPEGGPDLVVLTLRDITAERRVLDELRARVHRTEGLLRRLLGEAARALAPSLPPQGVPPGVDLLAHEAKGATVLLVDDEEQVRRLVALTLKRHGYRVLSASSGREALELEKAWPEPLHLLLTDVMMPGMTGPEVAVELGRRRPGLPVLLMSGYSPEAVGGNLLRKPFTPAALLERVRQALTV
jgi:CheY-like chemotaxis protein